MTHLAPEDVFHFLVRLNHFSIRADFSIDPDRPLPLPTLRDPLPQVAEPGTLILI
jgi:hypothetical protein